MKKEYVIIGLILVAGALTAALMFNRQPAEIPAPAKTVTPVAVAPLKVEATETATGAVPEVAPAAPVKEVAAKKKPKKAGKAEKAPIQDPDARLALSFVGVDPEAEAYWENAINDPNLPAEERKDLIEDLNEDGLSDPDHPGAEDMPLILSRIELIEELGPYAMDKVNNDAFIEAYKDLIGMADGRKPK